VSGSTSSASRSSPSSTKASASILASQIEANLRRQRDPRRAVAEKAYLKSDLEFIGATLPAMRQMVRAITREHPSLGRGQLLKVVSALWRRQVFETRMTAVLLLEEFQALLRPADIGVLERLLRESKTWAFVDELAIVIVGPLLQRSSQLAQRLDRWARDDDETEPGSDAHLDTLFPAFIEVRGRKLAPTAFVADKRPAARRAVAARGTSRPRAR